MNLLLVGALLGIFLEAKDLSRPSALRWRSQFDVLPAQQGSIVFVGDSITEGCHWSELLQNPAAFNRGIGGDTTADILDRLQQIYPLQPRKLFLMIGINDMLRLQSDEMLKKNYRAIFDNMNKYLPHTQIIIQSVLPVGGHWFWVDNQRIDAINNFLRSEALARDYSFVDLNPAFRDSQGNLRGDLSNDGLHLLGAGYQLWRNEINDLVNE